MLRAPRVPEDEMALHFYYCQLFTRLDALDVGSLRTAARTLLAVGTLFLPFGQGGRPIPRVKPRLSQTMYAVFSSLILNWGPGVSLRMDLEGESESVWATIQEFCDTMIYPLKPFVLWSCTQPSTSWWWFTTLIPNQPSRYLSNWLSRWISRLFYTEGAACASLTTEISI